MDKVIELVVLWIQKNLKNPRLYAALLVVGVALVLVFPYIDANFLFYNRIEKRIDILQSIVQIDPGKLAQNPELQEEYNSILSEMEQQRELSLSSIFSSEQPTVGTSWPKILSGGLLSWGLAVCMIFMGDFKSRAARAVAVILFVLLGIALGYFGARLPIFFNPWVNYIGFPIIQMLFLFAVASKPKKS